MNEEQMIEMLRSHLKAAKMLNWDSGKMSFIDGFLQAINLMFNKEYGFMGTTVYLEDENGKMKRV